MVELRKKIWWSTEKKNEWVGKSARKDFGRKSWKKFEKDILEEIQKNITVELWKGLLQELWKEVLEELWIEYSLINSRWSFWRSYGIYLWKKKLLKDFLEELRKQFLEERVNYKNFRRYFGIKILEVLRNSEGTSIRAIDLISDGRNSGKISKRIPEGNPGRTLDGILRGTFEGIPGGAPSECFGWAAVRIPGGTPWNITAETSGTSS